MNKNVHDAWIRHWRVFIIIEKMIESANYEEFKGLKLQSDVINKIYRINAEKWLPGF